MTFPEKVTTWGKAILVTGAILTGSVAIGRKAVTTVQAGPEAKEAAASLDFRVTRLEKQGEFLIRGMEKLTGTKYKGGGNDAR